MDNYAKPDDGLNSENIHIGSQQVKTRIFLTPPTKLRDSLDYLTACSTYSS